MAFTHETKLKMKKRRPMIRIEMVVSFFVNERMSTEAAGVLLMKRKIISVLSLKSYFERAAPQRLRPNITYNRDAIEECWRDKSRWLPAPKYFLLPLPSCYPARNK